ncbi:hypothetical protein N7510_006630 [Penicillium lagena]|uniref:uncharacterized protein n=1 Tax=Penicillium lagena TaxID=94218 RepID=UPI002540D3ED|nr:uncharacterized protein N7510_006630 [Penicillium lagena]KAJ5613436.1 hypothetical protein N7510_006630 [Penicillium lagena]
MHASAILFSLSLAATCLGSKSKCHFKPSPNATIDNYPGAPKHSAISSAPYNLNLLSEVPVADICTSRIGSNELDCARKYIDAIDEQLAFLYARRLGYAAVAGNAKYRAGTNLNDPSRNSQVAEGMAEKVLSYGGNLDAGRVMGGEGCQIYASLVYEIANIQETCNEDFDEKADRVCN